MICRVIIKISLQNNITLSNAKYIHLIYRQRKFTKKANYDASIMQLYWNISPYSSSV